MEFVAPASALRHEQRNVERPMNALLRSAGVLAAASTLGGCVIHVGDGGGWRFESWGSGDGPRIHGNGVPASEERQLVAHFLQVFAASSNAMNFFSGIDHLKIGRKAANDLQGKLWIETLDELGEFLAGFFIFFAAAD